MELGDRHFVQTGSIPAELVPDQHLFEEIWNLHPDEHSEILIHGKRVRVPRWDQAYEKDYPFAKQVAVAKSAPPCMLSFLQWAQEEIDSRFNGMFVNWHDGAKSHYHGKHRDSVNGLIDGTSIITISLGEERVFRMRPYPAGKPSHDIFLQSGDYVIIPWDTNQHWTHEVPKFARYKKRRVSVTMRAFQQQP